jgi:uncharacterized delta-60 repeat protein
MKNKKAVLIFALAIIGMLSANAQKGKIDETYGNLGSVNILVSTSKAAETKLLVLENNKTIVAGTFEFDSVFLVCFNENGTIDNTFGKNGIVVTALKSENIINGLFLGKDNKLLLVVANYQFGFWGPVLIKYNLNGSIETNYGIKLINHKSPGPQSKSALQNDGKIIVAASVPIRFNDDDIWLIKLNNDGTIDNTFGNKGNLYLDLIDSSDDRFGDITLLEDGKILACGTIVLSKSNGTKRYPFTLKLNENGSLDTTFGNKGLVISNYEDNTNQRSSNILLLPDQNFITTGDFFPKNPTINSGKRFLTMKFDRKGKLDTLFGNEGYAVDSFLDPSNSSESFKIIRQSDGKFIAGGRVSEFLGNSYTAMIRYDEGGQVDGTFGEDGKVVSSISPTGQNSFIDMLLQNDGKIVLLSYDRNNTTTLTRYLNDEKLSISKLNNQTISIYPNPATNILNIELPNQNLKNCQANIYSYNGSLLKTETLNNQTIDIANLPQGLYFIEILNNGNRYFSKFMKE